MLQMSIGAALAVPGLTISKEARAQRERDSVGIAVVGLGKLSQGQILPALKRTKGAHLAALVSGVPEKAKKWADEFGLADSAIYNYHNFDAIARDPTIQIVYIVLPNSMHAEFTVRSFKAGKHVLCEKPMSVTLTEAERMIAAGKAANRQLMIAYRCHYDPVNVTGMQLMRKGVIGTPRLINAVMGKQTTLSDSSDAWRLDMAMSGGGALADMGIYGINATRYLLAEEPTEVRGWARTDKSDPRFKTVEDMVVWQMKFPSGAIGDGSSCFSQPGTMAWQAIGTERRLVADPGCFYGGNAIKIVGGSNDTQPQVAEIDHFGNEMNWFADVVRGRVPNVSPGEEGLQDMRIMHAILQSVDNGGSAVKIAFGYKRAYDPATTVGIRTSI
ncbi:gfo/Idh/MocA family oxidoreductase [Sphingomonas glacialis]|uniref:Gfo/Idh/MocA family oxidoreductase n=1 Tax=Sphingomonas glacialis TaxID=658225 RepID=A0A502FRV5_9SPHN|nr:gfo/Idh/MocA family oxidoreductase [Sphingomonas glacialis]